MPRRDLMPQNAHLLEPFAEASSEHNVPENVVPRISLLPQRLRKWAQVCRERPLWPFWSNSQQNNLVIDAVSHGGLLQSALLPLYNFHPRCSLTAPT